MLGDYSRDSTLFLVFRLLGNFSNKLSAHFTQGVFAMDEEGFWLKDEDYCIPSHFLEWVSEELQTKFNTSKMVTISNEPKLHQKPFLLSKIWTEKYYFVTTSSSDCACGWTRYTSLEVTVTRTAGGRCHRDGGATGEQSPQLGVDEGIIIMRTHTHTGTVMHLVFPQQLVSANWCYNYWNKGNISVKDSVACKQNF